MLRLVSSPLKVNALVFPLGLCILLNYTGLTACEKVCKLSGGPISNTAAYFVITDLPVLSCVKNTSP